MAETGYKTEAIKNYEYHNVYVDYKLVVSTNLTKFAIANSVPPLSKPKLTSKVSMPTFMNMACYASRIRPVAFDFKLTP